MHESEAMRALARASVRAHIYAFTAVTWSKGEGRERGGPAIGGNGSHF